MSFPWRIKADEIICGMGAAVIFVMICATAITYPVYRLLEHFGIEYLKTVAFILVIAMFVQLVEIVMKR